MPWLTWPYALCKIGERGCLSGPVVVRTLVSVQLYSHNVSGDLSSHVHRCPIAS